MCQSHLSIFFPSPPQISLLEMPEYRRKKLMALTTNVMRDDSDKVNMVLLTFFV
jgi:hypothetical protein